MGSVIAVIDVIFPHKFSTILEVDYDTPYDRHIILQDKCHSHKSRKSPVKNNGSSIEVSREKMMPQYPPPHQNRRLSLVEFHAKDNLAFEEDDPKVNWKRHTVSSSHPTNNGHDALHRTQSVRYNINPNFASFLVLESDPSSDLKKGRKRQA